MSPVHSLFKSRKFLLVLLDLAVSTILYFTGKYVSPDVGNDVIFLVGVLQPVFATIIYSIAVEDKANALSGFDPITRKYVDMGNCGCADLGE